MRPSPAAAFVVIALFVAVFLRAEIPGSPRTNQGAEAALRTAIGRLRAGAYRESDHSAVSSLLSALEKTPEMALLAVTAAREEESFWRADRRSHEALIAALERLINASAAPTTSGSSSRKSPKLDLRSLHFPNFDGSGATELSSLELVPMRSTIKHDPAPPKEASSPTKARTLINEPTADDTHQSAVVFVGRGLVEAAGEALTALGEGAVDLAAATMAVGLAGITTGALREGLLDRAKVNFYDNALSAKLGESWGGTYYAQGKADLRLDRTKHIQNVGSEMKGLGKPILGAVLQGGVNFADNVVPLLANITVLRLVNRMGMAGRLTVAATSVKWSWQGGWNTGSAADEFGRAVAGYDEKAPASQERLYASVENMTEQSLYLPLLFGNLRSVLSQRASAPVKESAAWKPEIIPDRGYAVMLEKAARTLDGAASQSEIAGRGEALLSATQKTAPQTYAHMVRVGLMSGLVALRMGFSLTAAQEVERAARMHDVGKLDGSIQKLVVKQSPLTPGERFVVQRHPDRGALLITDSSGERSAELRHARRTALFHHEAWNGQGYPNGLHGTQIPMEARITTVADVYDALMENRPYRKAMTSQQALDIMSGQKERF
ncbi:MAG: HD domain-containing phosphohydrolase, partial [Elusimicrobiota bacterium]